ncbi:glycosyltransferase family 2 protein [Flavobacterium terrigena]|uniref:Dolichol-phosphate mannosyltransferase n=1 Tax=Flavobacterium terrigena TaxID=402734 RepID=A0A1H6TJ74_9FLAO|nr:glycosyltransferase family 2 protein [Flavobacterium terrigena]SEI79356.1 dolichol-phosphate mannosyltransferase [Flavobacterium terrigena]
MRKLLSLVVPVYYEQEVILQFLSETKTVLDQLDIDYEYVFVDDGSKDKTVEIISEQAKSNPKIKLVVFSYNHGKAAAVTAAIANAKGDYLLYMDPDLQDPPIEIPRFLEEIEKGYDLVWGIRSEKKDTFLNTLFSKIFWGSLNKFTGLDIPKGIAVMRIFNRSFADEFLKYNEANRFIEGIFINISKNWKTIEISQRERFAGKTKFNFRKKMQLAFDAIFDFSELPLKMAVRIGVVISILGFIALFVLLFLKFFIIDFESGWPSIIASIITGFGLQLFFLGIVSLYVGRIYKEVKRRPNYSIRNKININE